jgi:hypothetical protein
MTHLLSVPGLIVAEAAKACMPVLSLRAAMKLVLAWRSTSHVKVVPVWVGNCFIYWCTSISLPYSIALSQNKD